MQVIAILVGIMKMALNEMGLYIYPRFLKPFTSIQQNYVFQILKYRFFMYRQI